MNQYRYIAVQPTPVQRIFPCHSSWIIADQTDALAIFYDARRTFNGSVLLFFDNDIFHRDLKQCIITPDTPHGFTLEDGPNSVIFGNTPVKLIVDLSQIHRSKVSALNSLYDDPPRYLGRLLGPQVEIITVIPRPLALKGLTDDCYSRMIRIIPEPTLSGPDCRAAILTISPHSIPRGSHVIEFHQSPEWETIVFGQPKSAANGTVQFQISPWLRKLDPTQPITLVFKNPPIQNQGFNAFLIQLSNGLSHITVNGTVRPLPPVTVMVCNGYTHTEMAHLDTHITPKSPLHSPTYVINPSTIDHCFSSVQMASNRQITVSGGILDALSTTGGTLAVHTSVPKHVLQKIKLMIADHNIQHDTKITLASHSTNRDMDKLQPRVIVTNDPIRLTDQLNRPNAVILDISASTRIEDIFESWDIRSFENKHYSPQHGPIKTALDAGKTVIFRGIDSNPTVLDTLASLFEPTPYLWAFGQRTEYLPHQIIGIATQKTDQLPLDYESETFESISCAQIAKETQIPLKDQVRQHPIVRFEGPPGCGKTHQAELIGRALGGDECWSISMGPDADPDRLIFRREKQGDCLAIRPGPILKWATAKSKGPDHYPSLIVNEADVGPPGFLNFLLGLFSPTPHVNIGPNFYTEISKNHRVIITQNGDTMMGRSIDPILNQISHLISFKPNSPQDIMKDITRPLLIKRGISHPKVQDQLLTWITTQLPKHPSIRDYIDCGEQAAERINLPNKSERNTQFIEAIQAKYPEFDFKNKATRDLTLAINNRLRLAQTDGFMGKRGMAIEGPPGRGKDSVIDRVTQFYSTVESQPVSRITCTIGTDYFEMVDIIDQAKKEGHTLIISELNLLPTSIAEGCLNDALTGHHHPKFFLFLTTNSNREPFSDAFKNRLALYSIDDYSTQDLHALIRHRLHYHQQENSESISAQLVNFHIQIATRANELQINPLPTLRELLGTADQLGQYPRTPLPLILTHTYGLHLLRLNITDVHPLLSPPNQPDDVIQESSRDELISQHISEEEPAPIKHGITPTTPVNATLSPQSTAILIHPTTELPSSDQSDIVQIEPTKGPSLPIYQNSLRENTPNSTIYHIRDHHPIDFNGHTSQTAEEVAKAASYFSFHPDVSKHATHKREHRIYAYDHITQSAQIGLCKARSQNFIRLFTPQHHAAGTPLHPETVTQAIGTVTIPAGKMLVALPSLSPYEVITDYTSDINTPLPFFKDPITGFIFIISGDQDIHLNYKLELPTDHLYEYVTRFDTYQMPSLGTSSSIIPSPLRDLLTAINISDILKITTDEPYGSKIKKLTHYCSRFTQGFIPEGYDARIQNVRDRVPDADEDTLRMVNLILRKTGVCRHRCWAFLTLAGYFGVESRIIGNAIHDLIELHVENHRGPHWVKVELSELGFRTIENGETEVSKEDIKKICNRFSTLRMDLRRKPIQNKQIHLSATHSIFELEALVLSSHLSERIRKQELLGFCSYMLKYHHLDPNTINFRMPPSFDTELVTILSQAIPKWADFTDSVSRTNFLESARCITNLSHQLHDHEELTPLITHFFESLVQHAAQWDEENDAIAAMDLTFTMALPHEMHINRFMLQRKAFDAFFNSPHSELFKERISTKFFKNPNIHSDAKITLYEINAIKGEYFGTQLLHSEFLDQDEAYPEWLKAQETLLQELPRSNIATRTSLQYVMGINKNLFSTTTQVLNKDLVYQAKYLLTEVHPDPQKNNVIPSIFLKPLLLYIFHRLLQSPDVGSEDFSSPDWIPTFGPILKKNQVDIVLTLAEMMMLSTVFSLNTDPKTSAVISNAIEPCLPITDYDASEFQSLISPEKRDKLWKERYQLLQEATVFSDIHTEEDFKIRVWVIVKELLSPSKKYTDIGLRSNAISQLFSKEALTTESRLRWMEKAIVPTLLSTYSNGERHHLFEATIQSFSEALDRFDIGSKLHENQSLSRVLPSLLNQNHANLLGRVISIGPRSRQLILMALQNTPHSQWQDSNATLLFTLDHLISDKEINYDPYMELVHTTLSTPQTTLLIWQAARIYYIRYKNENTELRKMIQLYFKNVMDKPMPFQTENGFNQATQSEINAALQVLRPEVKSKFEKMAIATRPKMNYSFTKGTNIDFGRHICGAPFLKSTGFDADLGHKNVISRPISSFFSHQFSHLHIQAISTEIWKKCKGNIVFSTFLGTAQPTCFEEFSKIVNFMYNNDPRIWSTSPVIAAPLGILVERHPNSIIW